MERFANKLLNKKWSTTVQTGWLLVGIVINAVTLPVSSAVATCVVMTTAVLA